jgi:hypothetical protein
MAQTLLPNFNLSVLTFFTLRHFLYLCKFDSVTQAIISRSDDNIKIGIKDIT